MKGTFTVPCGYSTTGDLEIFATPVGGGDVLSEAITIDAMQTGMVTWEGAITGLTSSQSYELLVVIYITNGSTTKRYGAPPGTSQAK